MQNVLKQQGALMTKQGGFGLDTAIAAVADQRLIGADDTVTGNQDRQRVAGQRLPDGYGPFRVAEGSSDLSVGSGLPGGDILHILQHHALKRRVGLDIEGKIEGPAFLAEVLLVGTWNIPQTIVAASDSSYGPIVTAITPLAPAATYTRPTGSQEVQPIAICSSNMTIA